MPMQKECKTTTLSEGQDFHILFAKAEIAMAIKIRTRGANTSLMAFCLLRGSNISLEYVLSLPDAVKKPPNK